MSKPPGGQLPDERKNVSWEGTSVFICCKGSEGSLQGDLLSCPWAGPQEGRRSGRGVHARATGSFLHVSIQQIHREHLLYAPCYSRPSGFSSDQRKSPFPPELIPGIQALSPEAECPSKNWTGPPLFCTGRTSLEAHVSVLGTIFPGQRQTEMRSSRLYIWGMDSEPVTGGVRDTRRVH